MKCKWSLSLNFCRLYVWQAWPRCDTWLTTNPSCHNQSLSQSDHDLQWARVKHIDLLLLSSHCHRRRTCQTVQLRVLSQVRYRVNYSWCPIKKLNNVCVIPRSSLHDQTIIKQTSNRHRANVEQLEHTLCTCILNAFARCLLDHVNGYHNNIRRGLRQSD